MGGWRREWEFRGGEGRAAPGHYTMDRNELIRLFVLNEICDDYENVDQVILPNVAKLCAKLGLTVDRSDVVKALGELVESGLAKAYLLSCTEPFKEDLEGMPALDVPDTDFRTYFYITKKCMDVHLSDETWWPFDEHGEPLVQKP